MGKRECINENYGTFNQKKNQLETPRLTPAALNEFLKVWSEVQYLIFQTISRI